MRTRFHYTSLLVGLVFAVGVGACDRAGDDLDDLTKLVIQGQVLLEPSGDTTGVQIIARCGSTARAQTTTDNGMYELEISIVDCDPIVIEFRKPTFLPVVKSIPVPPPASPILLDTTLLALRELQCDANACVEEGQRFSEFPPGPMSQGWVTAMSGAEAMPFVGGQMLTTSGDVLWLTAFGYFDFRDETGATMVEFDGAGFNQCFELGRDVFDWLVDERPGDEVIQMSSFTLDEVTGLWTARSEDAMIGYTDRSGDEEVIRLATEADLASIRSDQFGDGSAEIWMCSQINGSGWLGFGSAIEGKTCVALTIQDICGKPIKTAAIDVDGRDHGFYTETWADRSGTACIELARSEEVGEDADFDALGGEEFFTSLKIRGDGGIHELTDHLNPRREASCARRDSCEQVTVELATLCEYDDQGTNLGD